MHELKIDNISHSFDKKSVLQDVSFNVRPGELTCLVGPSGCGKSTLLRLIAGLDPVEKGDIFINGKSVLSIPARKRQVGLVFQYPSLFPHLSVEENVRFGLHNMDKAQKDVICIDLLDMIGLTKFSSYYPHQLSGGQQQRVALARALAPKPRVMLLDEPFANLDHALRCEIREEVLGVLKSANIPIIMVTHDPEEALIMADKIVLLHADGHIHQVGDPEYIHNTPMDIEAAGFFGVINQIPGKIEGNYIRSELGDLPKESCGCTLTEGQEVVIATRPEGLRISQEQHAGVDITVESVQHTGAGWLIRTQIANGVPICFHHIYGSRPKVGETFCITYEPPHVFVFEKNS